MWSIQIRFGDSWITISHGHKSRGDAEWATAGWKQANQCYGDPFRAVQEEVPTGYRSGAEPGTLVAPDGTVLRSLSS